MLDAGLAAVEFDAERLVDFLTVNQLGLELLLGLLIALDFGVLALLNDLLVE
jgi:hypothetical protein